MIVVDALVWLRLMSLLSCYLLLVGDLVVAPCLSWVVLMSASH